MSVVMAVRNEAMHLEEAVRAVLRQDYPGELEIVMALGPSADATAAIATTLAAHDTRIRLVENRAGTTPVGLNAAIRTSSGEVVVRVDGHAIIPQGYVRRAVDILLETGAGNVGGIMAAEGVTPFEQAVAAAMSSRFGTGDARFHYGGRPGPVDTVYLGVFRRDVLEQAGGYDESFVRAQDAELNHRIRTAGAVVYFHPDLRVSYRPRSDVKALARQYFHSGRWRRVIVRRHPMSLKWRQVAAPLAVVGSLSGLLLGVAWRPLWFLLPATYGASLLGASFLAGHRLPISAAARLPLVFVVMHMAWGTGFLTSPRSLLQQTEEAIA